MCSNLWSHVQNTKAFSYTLLLGVVYSSQFYCLTSHYLARFPYLLETPISSEYGLTISGHVTAQPIAVADYIIPEVPQSPDAYLS